MKKFSHSSWVMGYVIGCTTAALSYVFVITFCHIPKENIRFADTALGFLLGQVLGTCISYLLVGSPDKKKDLPLALPDPDKKDDV